NGTKWQVFPTPNGYGAAADLNELVDVSVVADDDIWAVGISDRTGSNERSIVVHWDGTKWKASTPTGQVTGLASVSMLSSTYGLAVGQLSPPGVAVAVGFSGGAWDAQKLAGSQGQMLHGVVVTSKQEAWAVGTRLVHGSSAPFVDHFVKGSGWSTVPAGTAHGGVFWSVAASSTGAMWAVGTDYTNLDAPLISHWDGSAWTQTAAPSGTDAA